MPLLNKLDVVVLIPVTIAHCSFARSGQRRTAAVYWREDAAMPDCAVLIKEIQSLPPSYWGEVLDFVEHLKQTSAEEAAYRAMAADIDREQEAQEWCGAYFGPARNS
jgi:hypothetical protein